MKRYPYRERVTLELTDTTADYAKGSEVGHNRVLYVTHAAVEDQGSAPDQIAFGFLIDDEFVVMEEEPSPIQGISYHTEKTHHFLPGERPAFRIEGGTSTDRVEGVLEGYVEMRE